VGPSVGWATEKMEEHFQDETPEQRLVRMEEALAMTIKMWGPDGGPTAGLRADIAGQLETLGRFGEARLLRQEVLDATRHHRGRDHADTLTAEMWLGANLSKQDLRDEARPLFEHAYQENEGVHSVPKMN
jgi:hypothetical protein